jgi:hypothetical protein
MTARSKATLLAGTLIAQLLLAPAARAADRFDHGIANY